jgi:hypothetical protein
MFRLFVLLAAMIWGSVAHAEIGVYVKGVGVYSCGKFIGAIGDERPGQYSEINTRKGILVSENTEYQQWLLGYVSAYNVLMAATEQQQIRSDAAAMDLWMRNWCNKNPTKSVYDGVNAFINELQNNATWGQR